MRPTALASRCAATLALFAATLIAVLPVTALATIIHVPVDQPTIAAGIAAASPGDTVMMTCDTYYEHGLVISSAITLTSQTGMWGCVTIDGDATDTILRLTDADGAVVRGIEFTNGAALFGAGVHVDSCDVTFRNCQFYNNTAEVEGGGLRYRYGNPDISECDFSTNSASDRGGNLALSGTGGSVSDCQIEGGSAEWGGGACVRTEATTEFQSCTFSGNHAPGNEGYGGGFYCGNGAAPVVQACTFTNNTSGCVGGGAATDANCSPAFVECTFSGNSADWGGGVFAWEPAGGVIMNCYFIANSAQGGGGVALEGSGMLSVTSCLFDGNNASEAGGGLLLSECSGGAGAFACTFVDNTALYGGGMAAAGCDISVIVGGCTFALNEVSGTRGLGAGIAIRGGTPTTMEECIIAFSRAGEAAACEEGGAITAVNCVVYGNPGGNWVGCLSGQESMNNNAEIDPLFCGLGGAWFALCENSYCVYSNNPSGMQIGAHGPGCDACDSPVEMQSWGCIKAMFR